MADYPATRIEPCVCGGRIRADRTKPLEGIRNHQRSKQHRAYVARMQEGGYYL